MATSQERINVPIFVSSTYEDLVPYRDEVERCIIRMNQTIRGMEFFGSNPESPLEVCLKTVRESKIYVGIIGMRYGSILDESGKSFTELEYEEAVKNSIPSLIYILDENHPIAPKFMDTGEKARRLEDFKTRLRRTHVVSSFTTPADLGKKVVQDLTEELKKDRVLGQSLMQDRQAAEQMDDLEILRRFMMRPYKYYGQEIVLDVLLTPSQTNSIKASMCKGLGLQVGDVSSIKAAYGSAGGQEAGEVFVCGDGRMADWIESIREPRRATIKVRLAYCVVAEMKEHDGGVRLNDSMYKRLILLDVIQ